MSFHILVSCLAIAGLTVSAAGQAKPPAPKAAAKPAQGSTATRLSPEVISRPWTGDFDGMVKRRRIRILTPYSKTHYFIDKGVQYGIVYDAGVKLEQAINTLRAQFASMEP